MPNIFGGDPIPATGEVLVVHENGTNEIRFNYHQEVDPELGKKITMDYMKELMDKNPKTSTELRKEMNNIEKEGHLLIKDTFFYYYDFATGWLNKGMFHRDVSVNIDGFETVRIDKGIFKRLE